MTAAVLTKQVALTLAPPLFLYALIRHRWKGLAGPAAWIVSLAKNAVRLVMQASVATERSAEKSPMKPP